MAHRRVDFIDLTGKQFESLTVVSFAFTKKRVSHWNCVCKCGKERVVRSYYLLQGLRTSCRRCAKAHNGHHYVDITGQRFGKLVVLHVSHYNMKNGQYYWRCLCDCGKETVVQGCLLRTGRTKSCGCLIVEKSLERSYVDLHGRTFSRWFVFEYEGIVEGQRMWKCRCSCGTVRSVSATSLVRNHSQSCGCLRNERAADGCRKRSLPNHEAGFNRILNEYRTKNAERRDLPFELTREQFRELIGQNCHYCGEPPSKEQQGYKYNGLDRIDSSKGYTLDNVLPCCFTCNIAKHSMTTEQFRDWVERIYFNWILGPKKEIFEKIS